MSPDLHVERVSTQPVLAHLLAIEWDHPDWPGTCPVCGTTRQMTTHRPDCRLALAISLLAPTDRALIS
jgi:hypothetical protein